MGARVSASRTSSENVVSASCFLRSVDSIDIHLCFMFSFVISSHCRRGCLRYCRRCARVRECASARGNSLNAFGLSSFAAVLGASAKHSCALCVFAALFQLLIYNLNYSIPNGMREDMATNKLETNSLRFEDTLASSKSSARARA